jgi:hypothetical protein
MKYKAFIISICNYDPQPEDSQVVGYSDALVDHPFIPKPGSVIYDTVDRVGHLRYGGSATADGSPS